MGEAWNKVQKRKQAKVRLTELVSKSDQVIVIHYSWESFYDRPDGSSPRITSIAVRNKVLLGEPEQISESRLVDLCRLLISIYDVGYIPHPRLKNLIEKNCITHKDFLDGEAEADAFINKQYVKLHQSTLRKVDILANIVERIADLNPEWTEMPHRRH